MEKISIIVITKDEERNIKHCLESVKEFDEIVVVDSGSRDKTVEIAREYTSGVFSREFDDFSSQKNFALSKTRNEWILSLDADEVVSKELRERLSLLNPNGLSGYRIKRNTCIFGRLLKYGGHSKDAPLRLFDKNKGKFIQPIHEFMKIEGDTGLLNEAIIHNSSRDLEEYAQKLNIYTDLEVKFLLQKKVKFLYLRMIFFPILKFAQKYILQRGFLDKFEGFIFYAMSGFYEFLKWVKYWQRIK